MDDRSVVVLRSGADVGEEDILSRMRSENLAPSVWGNDPGYTYGSHSHPYRKILYCVAGAITFHTDEGDVLLLPGDRLELEKGVAHSATVGRDGVRCIEAAN